MSPPDSPLSYSNLSKMSCSRTSSSNCLRSSEAPSWVLLDILSGLFSRWTCRVQRGWRAESEESRDAAVLLFASMFSDTPPPPVWFCPCLSCSFLPLTSRSSLSPPVPPLLSSPLLSSPPHHPSLLSLPILSISTACWSIFISFPRAISFLNVEMWSHLSPCTVCFLDVVNPHPGSRRAGTCNNKQLFQTREEAAAANGFRHKVLLNNWCYSWQLMMERRKDDRKASEHKDVSSWVVPVSFSSSSILFWWIREEDMT